MIEMRNPGEMTTIEARHDSYETVDKQARYNQIIECLTEKPQQTAKEIAVMMMQKGYIPTAERNFTSPRITERMKKGMIEPIGKKVCQGTGQKVSVFTLRDA